MKLSRKATMQIQEAINYLNTGLAFIDNPKTHIVRETQVAFLPDSAWTCGDGKRGGSINKEIGSNLCQFRNALARLEMMIKPTTQEQNDTH